MPRNVGGYPINQRIVMNNSVKEAALKMGVGERMVRRLVAERRIEFIKIGKHVRISDKAIEDFQNAGTVARIS
jgi:excisionase family DNA binding protein